LLPSEPFAFDENHKVLIEGWLADTPAVQAGRVHLIDGSLITWHGTRMGKALSELPVFFHR
jgi:ABC-type hemin transport system substrate-binding protein